VRLLLQERQKVSYGVEQAGPRSRQKARAHHQEETWRPAEPSARQCALWLSPFHERDSVCIHFTWKPLAAEVQAALQRVEAALAPFEPRPHWGKVFIGSPAALYPRLPEFRALRARLDPDRVFGNAFDAQLGT